MCWSREASTVLAIAGFSGVAWAIYKKQPAPLWVGLGYFCLMEALQAFTYNVINQCNNPANQILTLLSYLHITFQPFFVSAVSMYFVPKEVQRRVAPAVYLFCFFSAIFMLIQLYPFEWAGHCDPRRPLCGDKLCSVRGNWHIAWLIPTNGICNGPASFELHSLKFLSPLLTINFPTYLVAVMVLPVIYGSWRFTLYHFLMGPLSAALLTDNIHEWPAVWCLLSVGLLLIVVKTPIRQILFVRRWIFWPNYINAPRLTRAAAN